MSWVLWDIFIPLLTTFALGASTGVDVVEMATSVDGY